MKICIHNSMDNALQPPNQIFTTEAVIVHIDEAKG